MPTQHHVYWLKKCQKQNLQMNGFSAAAAVAPCRVAVNSATDWGDCTTGANKQSDAIITLALFAIW